MLENAMKRLDGRKCVWMTQGLTQRTRLTFTVCQSVLTKATIQHQAKRRGRELVLVSQTYMYSPLHTSISVISLSLSLSLSQLAV